MDAGDTSGDAEMEDAGPSAADLGEAVVEQIIDVFGAAFAGDIQNDQDQEMVEAKAAADAETSLVEDARILREHMRYFNKEQKDHLEKVRDIVFALRCAKVTDKEDVVKVLVSDDPESIEVRKQRDIQEPVVDDSIDTLMMLQEIIFIYPDYDAHVHDFKVVWETWKRLDKRTTPGRFAPRAHQFVC